MRTTPEPNPTPPRPAIGPALRRSPADLDRLAKVNIDDILDAVDLWQDLAPPRYRNLIDAKPRETEESE